MVFRNLIGKMLFQGSITALHAKKKRVEEKILKMQLKVALLVKDADKYRVEHCVVSFAKS